ncbi:hypothetical protein [Ruminococcus sp. 5_1_39BFAA]|uniref:hypothetical protein n=1 Tax=Ruminococcus sp. 5_1_39BFAA TaxID=457412 RepID=UPI0035649393
MNKKLLSFVLAAIMLLSSSTVAFAEEYTEVNEFQQTASSQVNYSVQSSYSVKIPAVINDITYSGYSFEATSMNLLETQVVYITCEGNVNMMNERGDTFELKLYDQSNESNTVARFYDQETTSPIVMLGRPDNMGTLRAGYYTGTATFRVSLEEKPRS